jgi:hypothetical protein
MYIVSLNARTDNFVIVSDEYGRNHRSALRNQNTGFTFILIRLRGAAKVRTMYIPPLGLNPNKAIQIFVYK